MTSTEGKFAFGDKYSDYYDYRGEIARLNPNGVLDRSFAGDGIREMGEFELDGPVPGPSALLPSRYLLTVQDSILQATAPDGSLAWSKSFAPADSKLRNSVDRIFKLPGGSFLLAGTQWTAAPGTSSGTGWLNRRKPDGDTDTSYGPEGAKTFGLPARDTHNLDDVLRRPTGELLAISHVPSAKRGVVEVEQMHADGTPDLSFGDGGTMSYRLPQAIWRVSAATLDSEGRLLFAVDPMAGRRILLDRVLPDGSFDPSFGDSGQLEIDRQPRQLLPLPDGRVVEFENSGYGAEIRILQQDGSVDTEFGGGNGLASVPPLHGSVVSIDGDRILVAGTREKPRDETSRRAYKAEIVAFRLDDPGDDADLDGLSDAEDQCPDAPSGREDGCPLLHRELQFYLAGGRFSFDLSGIRSFLTSTCFQLHRVRVVRLTAGGSRTVFRGDVSWRHRISFTAPKGPRKIGRYRAILPAFNDNGAARCATQRSPVIRFRRSQIPKTRAAG